MFKRRAPRPPSAHEIECLAQRWRLERPERAARIAEYLAAKPPDGATASETVRQSTSALGALLGISWAAESFDLATPRPPDVLESHETFLAYGENVWSELWDAGVSIEQARHVAETVLKASTGGGLAGEVADMVGFSAAEPEATTAP